MTSIEYVYKVARVERVVDGDSYWLHLDTGFRNTLLVNVRLLGYDCPEARQGSVFERSMGAEATAAALDWFTVNEGGIWVRTEKDPDSFGRWLGEVWCESDDGISYLLGNDLHAQGLASIWPTRWHEAHDPGRDRE